MSFIIGIILSIVIFLKNNVYVKYLMMDCFCKYLVLFIFF